MDHANEMKLEFDSRSCNEGFARVSVAAFMTQLNPTLEEVADVKTALSEAVTNCVVHGYESRMKEAGDLLDEPSACPKIIVRCKIADNELEVEVIDEGCGIENVERAMEPLYTSKPDSERSGMGFAFMEAFMDEVCVESEPGKGTRVIMKKKIGQTINKFA